MHALSVLCLPCPLNFKHARNFKVCVCERCSSEAGLTWLPVTGRVYTCSGAMPSCCVMLMLASTALASAMSAALSRDIGVMLLGLSGMQWLPTALRHCHLSLAHPVCGMAIATSVYITNSLPNRMALSSGGKCACLVMH